MKTTSMNHPGDSRHHQQAENDRSEIVKNTPRLGYQGLSVVLIVMCLVPVITILVLWQYLPPVYEGQLQASVSTEGLPTQKYYEVEYYQRPPFEGGVLIVNNDSDQDWTQLNIQVNSYYSIHDTQPIPAGESKRYQLNRFLTRTGARFSLRYNEIKSVRIYARRPTKDRATYYHRF